MLNSCGINNCLDTERYITHRDYERYWAELKKLLIHTERIARSEEEQKAYAFILWQMKQIEKTQIACPKKEMTDDEKYAAGLPSAKKAGEVASRELDEIFGNCPHCAERDAEIARLRKEIEFLNRLLKDYPDDFDYK